MEEALQDAWDSRHPKEWSIFSSNPIECISLYSDDSPIFRCSHHYLDCKQQKFYCGLTAPNTFAHSLSVRVLDTELGEFVDFFTEGKTGALFIYSQGLRGKRMKGPVLVSGIQFKDLYTDIEFVFMDWPIVKDIWKRKGGSQ